jgi:hypothetical protein
MPLNALCLMAEVSALDDLALGRLIDVLISFLDARAGDADLEPDADDEEGADREPEDDGCCEAGDDLGTDDTRIAA